MSIIFGFLGGVVGAAVKGYVDVILERRREARATRAAVRLMATASSMHTSVAKNLVNSRVWGRWPRQAEELEKIWSENRQLLASSLDDIHWERVHNAYHRCI